MQGIPRALPEVGLDSQNQAGEEGSPPPPAKRPRLSSDMHTNGSSENSKAETNGSTASDVDNAEHFQNNNLNNKVANLNGHDSNGVGSHVGRVFIPPHQKDTVRLIGQHLLELGLQ